MLIAFIVVFLGDTVTGYDCNELNHPRRFNRSHEQTIKENIGLLDPSSPFFEPSSPMVLLLIAPQKVIMSRKHKSTNDIISKSRDLRSSKCIDHLMCALHIDEFNAHDILYNDQMTLLVSSPENCSYCDILGHISKVIKAPLQLIGDVRPSFKCVQGSIVSSSTRKPTTEKNASTER